MGNFAVNYVANEVTVFFNAGNEAISAVGRELDNFSKGGLGYLLQRSEDVEKSVKNAYNQTINNPKGTFIDAPANYLKSIPSRASYDWQQMTSSQGGEYTGRILFNVTSASAPLFKGATVTKSINYLDDVGGLLQVKNAAIAPAKRVTGETVIGRYPQYVDVSEQLGARRFEVPGPYWEKMTLDEQWTANKKFLDRTILRGDKIILSNPPSAATPGSAFAKELQYLYNNGYKLDGATLIPGEK